MIKQLSKMALLLCSSIALSAYGASAVDLQKQIDAQQRTMLEMQNRITELSTQVNTLRGDLEQLRYEISKIPTNTTSSAATTSETKSNVAKAQETASNSTQAASTSTSSSSSAQSSSLVLKSVEPKAQQEYDAAYAKVVNNDLSGASSAFTNYLQNYPDNTLTPNAWYWLAQVQYKQKKLDEARVSFLNVARFTSSTKRPDALYKLGLISKMRGDKDKAQAYFNLVIRTYPADTSSNLARKELASL